MFGASKEKEAALIETTRDDLAKLDRGINLPSYLAQEFKSFSALEDEYKLLKQTLESTKFPRRVRRNYKDRVRDIMAEMRGMQRAAVIVNAGYEPYSMPNDYFVAGVEGNAVNGLRFKAPIPEKAWMRYQTAKKTGLFEVFLIGAPDYKLFQEVSSIFAEPVIVGYSPVKQSFFDYVTLSRKGGQDPKQPGVKVNNGYGFLIAMWDLAKDRQAAGL